MKTWARDEWVTWELAAVAVETGIAPNDLLECDPYVYETIVSYMVWKAKQRG